VSTVWQLMRVEERIAGRLLAFLGVLQDLFPILARGEAAGAELVRFQLQEGLLRVRVDWIDEALDGGFVARELLVPHHHYLGAGDVALHAVRARADEALVVVPVLIEAKPERLFREGLAVRVVRIKELGHERRGERRLDVRVLPLLPAHDHRV
jgi:hypothetical protein